MAEARYAITPASADQAPYTEVTASKPTADSATTNISCHELTVDICFLIFSKVYLVKGQGSGLTGDRDYYDNSGNDQAFINFDLQADLTPLFNWNVKALYLYLTAEYITKENSLNEMVLWDKIVMNGEKMDLDMKSAKVKPELSERENFT